VVKPTTTWWFRKPHWILVIVSSFALLAGLNYLSPATEGVGFVAVACFLGIMARIAQAEWHEREAKRDMGED
jgi:predicted branched-subunit amino acid permease